MRGGDLSTSTGSRSPTSRIWDTATLLRKLIASSPSPSSYSLFALSRSWIPVEVEQRSVTNNWWTQWAVHIGKPWVSRQVKTCNSVTSDQETRGHKHWQHAVTTWGQEPLFNTLLYYSSYYFVNVIFMQTRNQKSIKFSVFTNKTPLSIFSIGRFELVCLCLLYTVRSSVSICIYICSVESQGWHSVHTAPWQLGSSQSIEFWSVSECEWIQSSTFLLFKVQVQSPQGLCGGGVDDGRSCSITMSRTWWIKGGDTRGPSCLHLVFSASRSSNPFSSSLQGPETNFLTVGIADNEIFKLKLKQQAQTQRGETGSKMCTVIHQAGGRGIVLSLESVRCIHNHKNSLSIKWKKIPTLWPRTDNICIILFLPDSACIFPSLRMF